MWLRAVTVAPNGESPSRCWLQQLNRRYLEKPLLLWGRKFDIRCWVVVTDNFDVYMYRDGYLRTSSEPFSLNLSDDVEGNSMVHLTNYCMQKNSENLGRFEEGNTLSYDELQECVRAVM